MMIQGDLFKKPSVAVSEKLHSSYCRFCGEQTRRANHAVEGCPQCGDNTSDTCIECFLNER